VEFSEVLRGAHKIEGLDPYTNEPINEERPVVKVHCEAYQHQ